MNNPITNEPFTEADADRILGLADQFLENWEDNTRYRKVGSVSSDPECVERRREWDAIRPLLVQAPATAALLTEARSTIHRLRKEITRINAGTKA